MRAKQKKGELGIAVPFPSLNLLCQAYQTLIPCHALLPVPDLFIKMSIFIANVGAIALLSHVHDSPRLPYGRELRSRTTAPLWRVQKCEVFYEKESVYHGPRDETRGIQQRETRA